MVIKVYVNNDEHEELVASAKEANMPLSAYITSQLTFKKKSLLHQKVDEAINRALGLSDNQVFSIKDLYTRIELQDLCSKVNPGQLGKQFYEKVKSIGEIEFLDMKGAGGVARYIKKLQ